MGPSAPNTFYIEHPASGLVVDVRDSGGMDAALQLWDHIEGAPNQMFQLAQSV